MTSQNRLSRIGILRLLSFTLLLVPPLSRAQTVVATIPVGADPGAMVMNPQPYCRACFRIHIFRLEHELRGDRRVQRRDVTSLSRRHSTYSIGSIAPASASLMAQRGAQVSDVITIAPLNGPLGNAVQLSCAVTGSTPLATCFLSPTSVTAGANPATATLTITAPSQRLA